MSKSPPSYWGGLIYTGSVAIRGSKSNALHRKEIAEGHVPRFEAFLNMVYPKIEILVFYNLTLFFRLDYTIWRISLHARRV